MNKEELTKLLVQLATYKVRYGEDSEALVESIAHIARTLAEKENNHD